MAKSKILTGPEEIHGVSQSQFSIARFYGGAIYNGTRYVYDAERDVLIREDVFKRRKAATWPDTRGEEPAP